MARIYHMLGVALLALSIALPAAMGEVTHTATDITVNFDGEATEFDLKIEVFVTETNEAGNYTVTITNPTEHEGINMHDVTMTKTVTSSASKVYTFTGNTTDDVEEGTYKIFYTVTGPNGYSQNGEISIAVKEWQIPCFDFIYAPAAAVVLFGAVWAVRRK